MRAVFLDRDGCLTDDWLNPATGAWESPLAPDDLRLRPGALAGLGRMRALGYGLILVSNQPSFAKGKCTLEDLRAVHARFLEIMAGAGIDFLACHYSYSHPESRVPGYGPPAADRKPHPHFLLASADRFGLDLDRCWMIGDRDSDVLCGQRAGTRTIQVASPHVGRHAGNARPDIHAPDLLTAADLIGRHDNRAPSGTTG